MAAAPLLHKVPSLIGWPGSPSILMTLPLRVETTWPQPTPQKGQTVVVSVAPRVLSGGIAGSAPRLRQGADRHRARRQSLEELAARRLWRLSACCVIVSSSLHLIIFIYHLCLRMIDWCWSDTAAAFVPNELAFISHIHSGNPAETFNRSERGDRNCTLVQCETGRGSDQINSESVPEVQGLAA